MENNNRIYFKPYCGYGDWISVNGLVRFLTLKYDEVVLIVGDKEFDFDINFVKNLYKDNSKIKYTYFDRLDFKNDKSDYLNLEIWEHNQNKKNSNFYDRYNPIGKKFGFNFTDVDQKCYTRLISPYRFTDECKKILENNATSFYVASGVPKEYRMDYFYYMRDIDSEDKFFNSLNLPKKYIVISDSKININYIKNKELDVINVNFLSKNYFDIIKVIENAEEIHLIENSISLLIYHLQYKNLMKNCNINFHTYVRKEDARICSSSERTNLYVDMFMFPKLKTWKFIY